MQSLYIAVQSLYIAVQSFYIAVQSFYIAVQSFYIAVQSFYIAVQSLYIAVQTFSDARQMSRFGREGCRRRSSGILPAQAFAKRSEDSFSRPSKDNETFDAAKAALAGRMPALRAGGAALAG